MEPPIWPTVLRSTISTNNVNIMTLKRRCRRLSEIADVTFILRPSAVFRGKLVMRWRAALYLNLLSRFFWSIPGRRQSPEIMPGASIDDLYRIAGPTGPGASSVAASPRQPTEQFSTDRTTDRPVGVARIYYGAGSVKEYISSTLADPRTSRIICAQESNTKSMRRRTRGYL